MQVEAATKAQAIKEEAGRILDEKVDAFKKQVAKMGAQQEPKLELLRTFFTPTEMSALWGRLTTQRGKSDMSIKEAWGALCSLPTNSALKKRLVMLDFVIKPPGAWQTTLLTQTDDLTRKDTNSRHNQQYTRGELEVIHGIAEASRLIEAGKFDRAEDSDGDEVFVKRIKSSTSVSSREQTMSFNRSVLYEIVQPQKSLHNNF